MGSCSTTYVEEEPVPGWELRCMQREVHLGCDVMRWRVRIHRVRDGLAIQTIGNTLGEAYQEACRVALSKNRG